MRHLASLILPRAVRHNRAMSATIRKARPNDLAAVEAIVQSAYAIYIPRIGRKPGPMNDDYASQIGNGQLYVLDADGAIQGVLVLIPEASTMLLHNVAIAPDAQGRGLGRKLLEFADSQARERGFRSIRLYTHERMTENIARYLRFGYVETHRGTEAGLHRVFMTKTLT
jgi:GNAT superfamily N-acetyltransferase